MAEYVSVVRKDRDGRYFVRDPETKEAKILNVGDVVEIILGFDATATLGKVFTSDGIYYEVRADLNGETVNVPLEYAVLKVRC